MSQHVMDSSREGMEILIGWDQPMNTFFAQVWAKRDDEEPVVWLGNAFDQVQEPEEMAEDLEPFGAMPDDLLAVLRADRAVGDEEKSVQQWADMGPIKLDRVHQVLDQMRAIAEEIDDPMADYEDYERGRAKYQREIDDATSLRTFG